MTDFAPCNRVVQKASLQCRRFWWFSSFECLAAILDSLQTGRIGARMRCENVGGGGGRGGKKKTFPLPLPPPQFLSPSHWLGKLFTSPQLSTVFLIQDGGLNNRWKYPLAPAKTRLHCRLAKGLFIPGTKISFWRLHCSAFQVKSVKALT